MKTRIDISIGPVQGFIAQARRTRDLWGGSFLLSFLAARAMAGARNAGATVIQPHVEDDALLEWASGEGQEPEEEIERPKFGTITNHFAVETTGSPREVANAARESFNSAWRQVCAAVWERYVWRAVSASDGAEAIWNRQIENFWEFNWTAGDPSEYDESMTPLARRKLWRSHRPADEPGDKCTVMSDFQELSGYVRATDRAKQDAFWDRIRDQTRDLDIKDDKERLCAIALVKRLFPHVAKSAVGWEPDMSSWPSTLDMGESSFYALLFADGDRLGKLIAEMEGDGVRIVSESVSRFVKAVPDISAEYDGVAIYAGGEDALIMLPVDKAIECAQAISREYRASFSEHTDRATRATASASVVFAHQRGVSLRAALEEGRRLLDDVAKDGNGRDSLAVSVLKPSGRYCEWASSWDRGGDEDDGTGQGRGRLAQTVGKGYLPRRRRAGSIVFAHLPNPRLAGGAVRLGQMDARRAVRHSARSGYGAGGAAAGSGDSAQPSRPDARRRRRARQTRQRVDGERRQSSESVAQDRAGGRRRARRFDWR